MLLLPRLRKLHRQLNTLNLLIPNHHNESPFLHRMRRKINILGQSLRTSEDVGYVVTDVNKSYDDAVVHDLRAVSGTLRFRVLY